MPSLLGAASGFRSAEPAASPRSVTPGRQRWDVGLVVGRPRTAEILAAALRHIPGITEAQASPVTGGVLVRHDARLCAADVGRIIGRTVARLAREAAGTGRAATDRSVPAPGRTGASSYARCSPSAAGSPPVPRSSRGRP